MQMKSIKKLIRWLLLFLLVLIGILLANTLRFNSKQVEVAPVQVPPTPEKALQHLQRAIQFKTISKGYDIPPDSAEFVGFQHFLEETYPLIHQKINRELVSHLSLLYKWQGTNPLLKPIILMAHQDVVPIEPGTEKIWTVNPFEGKVKDGFIWGRGTTDDKLNLISIMETAERLLAENYQPERTMYFVFGHDEEVMGRGAAAIAKLMKNRGIKAEFVMDEGGIITKDKIPGLHKMAAVIGTSEKGYLSVELSIQIPGGHSSMPAKETSIDILTQVVVKLRANQLEADLVGSTKDMLDYIGPEMPFAQKMVMANQWLFKSLILNMYGKTGSGNAAIRTTTSPTIIHAGMKDNVIPTNATATINFRILPGESSASVIQHIKDVIADDRVKIKVVGSIHEPSPVTNVQCFGFQKITNAVKQNFPGSLTAPFLMIGATDSRHFTEVSENILKFSPMIDPIGFHGIDERVSLESYQRGLSFYYHLIKSVN